MAFHRKWPRGYYTYIMRREDGTPYYVGAGKNNRASLITKSFPPGINLDTEIIEAVTKEEAFVREEILIKQFGRSDLGTGPLTNKTDGRGTKGLIRLPESNRKIAEAARNRPVSAETRCRMSQALLGNKRALGLKHSEETRRGLSEKGKGRRWTGCQKIALKVTKLTTNYTPEQREAFSKGGKSNARYTG